MLFVLNLAAAAALLRVALRELRRGARGA